MLNTNETEMKTTRQTRSRTAFKCIQSRFDRIRSIGFFLCLCIHFRLLFCFQHTHTCMCSTHHLPVYKCKTSRCTRRDKQEHDHEKKATAEDNRKRKKPIRMLNLETFVYTYNLSVMRSYRLAMSVCE